MSARTLAILVGCCVPPAILADGQAPARLEADAAALGIPYHRYTTQDGLGRTITFYLSAITGPERNAARSVVLLVGGSGCQSLFQKHGDRVFGGLHNLLLQEAGDRVRVLVVEKPGVCYLDSPRRPGSAEGARPEFLAEHTLERWVEANAAALRAAWTLPAMDRSRTLAIGHSEGGLVVACLAAKMPEVTHVASLAAGGPTQLFSLLERETSARPGDEAGDATRRRQAVLDEWARIQADPESTTRFWLGHPYRRWSTFLKHSVTDELLRTKARIYLAQGTSDAAQPPTGHEVLVAELRAHCREIREERVEGGDHSFAPKNSPPGPPRELQAMFCRILGWFLTTRTR
jgi:pimeloyl-ACP methyl ester carboxylesterase